MIAGRFVLTVVGFMIALAACGDARRADAPAAAQTATEGPLVADALLADSAGADSVALASLPPRLREDLDMGPLLSARSLADTSLVYCEELSQASEAEVRKRLRARWPEQRALVLFVRATRASGAINRVELVRRTADSTQRGYIWDRETDETRAVEWMPGSTTPETRELPEGTPAPRALRGLGRRLLVLPCRDRNAGN